MQTVNKGGDVLARGNTSCQFPPAGGNVTEKKWKKIFEGWSLEDYMKGKPAEGGIGKKEETTS